MAVDLLSNSNMAEKLPKLDDSDSQTEESSNVQEISKELRSDTSSTGEASVEATKIAQESVKSEEREYITGFKLGMVVVGVTLVCFLVLLDISIIVTVSCPTSRLAFQTLILLGHSRDHHRFSFFGRFRLVW